MTVGTSSSLSMPRMPYAMRFVRRSARSLDVQRTFDLAMSMPIDEDAASWADVIPSHNSTYCYLLFWNRAVFSWTSAVEPSLLCQLQKQRWSHYVLLHKKLPFFANSHTNLAFGNSVQYQYIKTTRTIELLQKQATSKDDPSITSFVGNWLQEWSIVERLSSSAFAAQSS